MSHHLVLALVSREEQQEAEWRRIHGPSRARAYPVGGLTVSREAAHYYGIILGVNRAINWVARRTDIDSKRFFYTGASQGGGFGLILTALNPCVCGRAGHGGHARLQG